MEFRLAHHFFPSSFGWFHWFSFGVLAAIAFSFYKHRLRWFIILILAGCVVYTIGVEMMGKPFILYSQWFKTTIWLEAFAFIAVFVWLEKNWKKAERLSKYWFVVPVVMLLFVGTYRLSGWFGPQPTYMISGVQEKSAEVQISELARDLTPEDAVFIVPIEFSAFRWYAKRSLYVDYKALFHSEDFLFSWYTRIQNIYAFSMKEQETGFEIQAFSDELLSDPMQLSIDYWRGLGITHIISANSEIEILNKLGEQGGYVIYGLR